MHYTDMSFVQTVLDIYKQRGFKNVFEPLLAGMPSRPALRLTIWEGEEQLIPVQDVGKLALRDVAQIYTVSLAVVLSVNL